MHIPKCTRNKPQTQKTCSCGVVLNSMGLLAAPDSIILAVVEILLVDWRACRKLGALCCI